MAVGMNDKTVVGVFDDYSTAEQVARELTNAGFTREMVDVRSNFRTGAAGRGYDETEHEGGISGFFHRLFGGEESETGHYAEAVRRGNAIVTVTAPEAQVEQAVTIMNSAGAIDIDRHVENYRETGYERHDPSSPAYSYDDVKSEREGYRGGSQEGGSIPVVQEELQVGKRAVQRGGVRVYSRVIDEPVEQNVELREEKVRVERRQVDRPISTGELSALRDQSIEVTEMSEEPVVQKRARVREEVVVGKDTTQRTEKVQDTLRRTEVEVERIGAEDVSGQSVAGQNPGGYTYSDDFRRDWESRYATSGDPYNTYEPAYQYGYESANDARWSGRKWSDVETDLRSDYESRYPGGKWERMKDSVRYGWEKVTGRR